MADSKREQVQAAVFALLQGIAWSVTPQPRVTRNEAETDQVPTNGRVNLWDGDPGQPIDVLLSPRAYTYAHPLPVHVIVQAPTSAARDALADALCRDIGVAVKAAAEGGLLGDLVDDLEVETIEVLDEPVEGDAGIKAIEIPIVATYDAASPLT